MIRQLIVAAESANAPRPLHHALDFQQELIVTLQQTVEVAFANAHPRWLPATAFQQERIVILQQIVEAVLASVQLL